MASPRASGSWATRCATPMTRRGRAREGIFDLSGWPHALFFGGICLALVGLFAMLVGPEIYKPGSKLTVGRRLAQVGAPLAAVVLVAGCAAITSNSTLARPVRGPARRRPTPSRRERRDATRPRRRSHARRPDATSDDDAATGDTGATGGADAHSHGTVIAGTATGKSPCEVASPTPASPGQVGAGEGGSAPKPPSASTVAAACSCRRRSPRTSASQLEQQMARSAHRRRRSTRPRRTRSRPATACRRRTCRASARTTRTSRSSTKFDPAAPSELLYDGTKPDSKIVGLSYLVYHPGGPPDGFAGTQRPLAPAQRQRRPVLRQGRHRDRRRGADRSEECAARGGAKTRAHRHLDGARVGRARRSSAAGASSPASAPSSGARPAAPPGTDPSTFAYARSALTPTATSSRCGATGSPSRRGPRARRASTCPDPSRARAAPW